MIASELSGVVSLADLQQFYTEFFIPAFAWLNGLERISIDAAEEGALLLTEDISLAIHAKVQLFRGHAEIYEFKSVADQCQRIERVLKQKQMSIPPREMSHLLGDLRQRCQDEMGSAYFLHLDPKQAKKYLEPEEDWEAITARFHKTRYNVEECGKCFALERYGAAVFFALLVAEYGVIQIAKFMKLPSDKPGWADVGHLHKLIDKPYPNRDSFVQQHSHFLEAVLPLLKVLKDSWRHKITHADNQIVWVDTDFSPQVADEIIKATRGFMRKLAKELPK